MNLQLFFESFLPYNVPDIIDMDKDEKDRAVVALISDYDHADESTECLTEHLIRDRQILECILLGDVACGNMLKNCVYTALESKIQDEIYKFNSGE